METVLQILGIVIVLPLAAYALWLFIECIVELPTAIRELSDRLKRKTKLKRSPILVVLVVLVIYTFLIIWFTCRYIC